MNPAEPAVCRACAPRLPSQVGPAPGQRFSAAFLAGVEKFVAYQLGRQQAAAGGSAQPTLRSPPPPPPPQPPASPHAAAGAGHGRAAASPRSGRPELGESTAPGSPQADEPPATPEQLRLWQGEEGEENVAEGGGEGPDEGASGTGSSSGSSGELGPSMLDLVLAASEAGEAAEEGPGGTDTGGLPPPAPQLAAAAAAAWSEQQGKRPSCPAVVVELAVVAAVDAAADEALGAADRVQLRLHYPAAAEQPAAAGEAGSGPGAHSTQSRGWWPPNALAEVLPDALPVGQVDTGASPGGRPTPGRGGGRRAANAGGRQVQSCSSPCAWSWRDTLLYGAGRTSNAAFCSTILCPWHACISLPSHADAVRALYS